jgi:hypothetical protein
MPLIGFEPGAATCVSLFQHFSVVVLLQSLRFVSEMESQVEAITAFLRS